MNERRSVERMGEQRTESNRDLSILTAEDVQQLDNPMWSALERVHHRFGYHAAFAKRFDPAVSPFFAFQDPSAEAYRDVAFLLREHGPQYSGKYEARSFRPLGEPMPHDWQKTFEKPIMQMILPGSILTRSDDNRVEFESLIESPIEDILQLIEIAKPGPFAPRTRELGLYLGVRQGERLVAMTGERMRFGRFTEISAVATHPNVRGKGLARLLVERISRGILDRGQTPILHVFPDNESAISLYKSIGFIERTILNLVAFQPKA